VLGRNGLADNRQGAVTKRCAFRAWRTSLTIGRSRALGNRRAATSRAASPLARASESCEARTALEWEALFGERVPCAAARTVEDMFEHPQVASEGILASFEHPRIGRYRGMAHPIHFGDGPAPAPVAAPELGQHSREILMWLGYADEDIERLHGVGAVVGPSKGARA